MKTANSTKITKAIIGLKKPNSTKVAGNSKWIEKVRMVKGNDIIKQALLHNANSSKINKPLPSNKKKYNEATIKIKARNNKNIKQSNFNVNNVEKSILVKKKSNHDCKNAEDSFRRNSENDRIRNIKMNLFQKDDFQPNSKCNASDDSHKENSKKSLKMVANTLSIDHSQLPCPIFKDISKWIKKEGTIKAEKLLFTSKLKLEENVCIPKVNIKRKKNVNAKIKKDTLGKEEKKCTKLKLDEPVLPTAADAKELNSILDDYNSVTNLSKISCPSILKLIGLYPSGTNITEQINEKLSLKRRCITRSTHAELNKGRNFYDIIKNKINYKKKCSKIQAPEPRKYNDRFLAKISLGQHTITLDKENAQYQSTKDRTNLRESNQYVDEKTVIAQSRTNLQSNIFKNTSDELCNIINKSVDSKQNTESTKKEEKTRDMLFEKSLKELIVQVKNTEETLTFSETKSTVLRLLESSLSIFKEQISKKIYLNEHSLKEKAENLDKNSEKLDFSKKIFKEKQTEVKNTSEIEETEPLKLTSVDSGIENSLLTITLNNLAPGAAKFVLIKDKNNFEVTAVQDK